MPPAKTAQNLVKWLTSCQCTEVEPVEVTLGKETFQGARYRQHGELRIYLLGDLPREKKRRPRSACWEMDGNDWYVSGYYQGTASEYRGFHPFGRNFMLMMWDVVACKGAKIDTGERWAYHRFPMSVKVLTEK